jgi:hypothetical protein
MGKEKSDEMEFISKAMPSISMLLVEDEELTRDILAIAQNGW